MQLMPEMRVANEIILNALRSLKFSGFDADTQRTVMECVGEMLVRISLQYPDTDIDTLIKRVEDALYGDTRAIINEVLKEQENES